MIRFLNCQVYPAPSKFKKKLRLILLEVRSAARYLLAPRVKEETSRNFISILESMMERAGDIFK